MVRKGMFPYDALLHVPLLWWAPGRIPTGARTDALAQSADLFPTLAELTGAERPEDFSGVSVAESVLGRQQAARHCSRRPPTGIWPRTCCRRIWPRTTGMRCRATHERCDRA